MTDLAASSPATHRRRATLIGALAVLMWSTLALFTALSGQVPPVQLVAMAFLVAGLVGMAVSGLTGRGILRHFRQPIGAWVIGAGGLFFFHAFYFASLRLAPPVEANLINYLWPLLIVLFSALLPGERLRWYHVLGALMGLAGAWLLVTKGQGFQIEEQWLPGYIAAIGSALTWSSYSVLNRRFARVPTEAVTGFCLATAALGAIGHLAIEETVMPVGAEWLAVLALGLAPVGAAFFVWDYGTKHGDIRALGALAYGAPLFSTILLILFGLGQGHWTVWAACVLIIGGAALASRDILVRRG